MAYDKAVEADKKTEYDLPPEKAKIAQKFAHAGTRKQPTAYKFTTRQRKPNATKGGIIAELAEFLEKTVNSLSLTCLLLTRKDRLRFLLVGIVSS